MSSFRLHALLISLQSLLASFQLLSSMRIGLLVMVHRVWVEAVFNPGLSLAAPLLLLLSMWALWAVGRGKRMLLLYPAVSVVFYPFLGFEATLSIAVILASVISFRIGLGVGEYVRWALVFLTGFFLLALLHYVLFLPLGLTTPLRSFAELALELFYMFSFLGPVLGVALAFASIVVPLLILMGKHRFPEGGYALPDGGPSFRLVLILALVLSVVAAAYPYVPNVNPRGVGVGVDIGNYVAWAELVRRDVGQAFAIEGGSRPLFLLMVYGLQRLFSVDASTLIRFMPVLLNPILILAVFFLACEVFGGRRSASWAAFFTATGVQLTVGMYSYFLTDMLALSLVFASLGLLFRALRRGGALSLLFSLIFGASVVFTHPWTFVQYGAPGLLFSVVVLLRRHRRRVAVAMVLFVLVALAGSELLKAQLLHGMGGLQVIGGLARSVVSVDTFLPSVAFAFNVLYGGLLADVLLLALAVIGLFSVSDKDPPWLFFALFMFSTSLAFLLLDGMSKGRLLYNVPFGLLAALGYVRTSRWRALRGVGAYPYFMLVGMILYLFISLSILS